MKTVILIGLAFLSCSCATIKTINPENNHVKIEHRGKESYCKEIPRLYSGLMYNACLFYGEPNRTENWGSTFGGTPLFIIDATFSIAADTIVIPYTAVQQKNKGNIRVN